jgi:hypothetical protein
MTPEPDIAATRARPTPKQLAAAIARAKRARAALARSIEINKHTFHARVRLRIAERKLAELFDARWGL